MADKPQGIEGDIHGKPLSADVKQKIEEVLKTTLEQELAKEHKTVGAQAARRPSHGSVTHGSVSKAAAT
jgi:hypothetical protein